MLRRHVSSRGLLPKLNLSEADTQIRDFVVRFGLPTTHRKAFETRLLNIIEALQYQSSLD